VCDLFSALPKDIDIRSAPRAARARKGSLDRDALRSFVDACQILVGHIDTHAPASAAWLREILLRMLRATPHQAAAHASANVRVPRVVRCIEDRFAEATIHLASVATAVDITPSQLNRLLKEHTGLTFRQQLRRIRMRHADQLLLTTAASIRDVACACGYTSLARFGRDFQRAHGCAPRVWRAHRTLLDVPFT
jgi:AraC-like DNA-binding protein